MGLVNLRLRFDSVHRHKSKKNKKNNKKMNSVVFKLLSVNGS